MTNKRKRDAEDDEYVDNGDTSFSYREDEFSAEMDDDVGRKGKRNRKGKINKSVKGGGNKGRSGGGDIGSRAKQRLRILEGDEGCGEDETTVFKDFSDMTLSPDHATRPLWVCPDGRIFLETTNKHYFKAYDFLVAIAEPVSRPEFLHEYKITPYSLYAAVAVAIDTEKILRVLQALSKNLRIPKGVEQFVRQSTLRYGRAKLVLKQNKYFVESIYPEALRELLTCPEIAEARLNEDEEISEEFISDDAAQEMLDNNLADLERQVEIEESKEGDDQDPDVMYGTRPGATQKSVSFRIDETRVEVVKHAAINMDYPLMEEYDFRHDVHNPNLKLDLKPTTKVREYQEKSLRKMFGNGRARSGNIVLPCGAGKTLTGVTAASTIKKSTLVLCTSGVSVIQWKYQFQLWTDIASKDIACFTSSLKDPISKDACVLVTTYSMMSHTGKRSADAEIIIEQIKSREWGLMILDEVHVVPATMFRKVLSVCNAHCKLGLTATLVREDDLISDLNFLIGPKLYEANWMDLTSGGYLANVQCIEAWCPMTPSFYRRYLQWPYSSGSKPGATKGNFTARKRELLYVMNPNKFRTCEFLVRYHQNRGDKIIVFSDNVYALKKYATLLKIPYIYGGTREAERQRILGLFRINPLMNCVGLSKVGDTSIDIPEANVIIQVSSHFGSRRQEAQRLGRILRPKVNISSDGFNAFFYTLVSTDTGEMYFSTKRQQYLVDQGYTFKVVADLVEHANKEKETALPEDAELSLLANVLSADDKEDEEEASMLQKSAEDDLEQSTQADHMKVMRRVGKASGLSGAGGGRYMEYDSGVTPNSTILHMVQERKEKQKSNFFHLKYKT